MNRPRQTREDLYWYMRDQGRSHMEALAFANRNAPEGPRLEQPRAALPSTLSARPTEQRPGPTVDRASRIDRSFSAAASGVPESPYTISSAAPPPPAPAGPEEPRTLLEKSAAFKKGIRGFGRGLTSGARGTAASYAGGASWLTGGGNTAVGRALESLESGIAGDFQPETASEKAGRLVGRFGTEIAAAMTGGGLLVRGATAIPKLSRVASALQSTSRLKRGGAYAVTQAPLDVLMGSRDEEPLLLPSSTGRLGAIAENVALSGVAGALVGGPRKARAATESADEGATATARSTETPAPTADATPAPSPLPVPEPTAARAPTAAADDPIFSILEKRPATFKRKDGTFVLDFESPLDGAAWIAGTKTKDAATARQYLKDAGFTENQVTELSKTFRKKVIEDAKAYVFAPEEVGTIVVQRVAPVIRPRPVAAPAADAVTEAPVKPVKPTPAPTRTQAAGDEMETLFRPSPDAEPVVRAVVQPIAVGKVAGARTATNVPGAEVPAGTRYAVVEASDLTPSHSPSTFAWSEGYPKAMQQRDYSATKAYQDAVNAKAAALDPDRVLDTTRFLSEGPPLVSSTGLVISGNDRTMSIVRAAELYPKQFAQYRQALIDRAGEFGLTASDFAGAKQPVLVRIVDEPAPVSRLTEINRASDVSGTKDLTRAEEAASRANVMEGGGKALEFFGKTIDPEATIKEYLSTPEGREFTALLIEGGAIPQSKLPSLMVKGESSTLNAAGREYVSQMISSSAYKRAADLPDGLARKMEHAAAPIASMKAMDGWDVAPVVDEALEVLIQHNRSGMKLEEFLSQRSAFDGSDFSNAAKELARFIVANTKTEITNKFRWIGKMAAEATDRSRSGMADMFGETVTASSLDDAWRQAFGFALDAPAASRASAPRLGEAGFATREALSTLLGAGLGAQAGAFASDENRIAGAIGGGIAGGAAGAVGARVFRRPKQFESDDLIARGDRSKIDNRGFLEFVTRKEGVGSGWRSALAEGISRFRTQVAEGATPARLFVRKTLGRETEKVFDGMIARFAGSAQDAMQYMDDVYRKDFFQKYDQATRNKIARFAVARRSVESNLPINMAPEEVRRLYDEGMADPTLREGSEKLMSYFRDLLEMRYRAGLISSKEYRRIIASDEYYVPFLPDFIARTGKAAKKGSDATGWNVASNGVEQMQRDKSARDWLMTDPYEVLVMATVGTFRDVARARTFNIIANAVDVAEFGRRTGTNEIGKFIYRVNPNSKSPYDAYRFQALGPNGRMNTYEVRDPELFEAIAGSPGLWQHWSADLLRSLANFKRNSIVLEPTFSLLQSTRDVLMYAPQRKDVGRTVVESAIGGAVGAGVGATVSPDDRLKGAMVGGLTGMSLGSVARPVTQILAALSDVTTRSDAYKEWIRMGGSSEGLRVRDFKDAQDILRSLERSGVSMSDVLVFPRWIDALKFIASAGEQAPRLATYKEAVARGVSPTVAVLEGQKKTVRFASRGANPLIREIAATTPFFNAKIQGWDKMIDMLKRPETSLLSAITISAPTIGLFMLNKDNPDYWNRPQWERDLFWLVPKPDGGFYRIPRPFEIGYLFGALPERFMSYLAETGRIESKAPRKNVTGVDVAKQIGKTFAIEPVAETFPVPTFLEIPLSQAVNMDFFRGRELVPDAYRNLLPGDQTTPYTGALPRAAGKIGASPIRVEKLLRDIGGTGYTRLSDAVLDPAARAMGLDAPVQRERDMNTRARVVRSTGLSRFETREYDATSVEVDARERLRKIDRVYGSLQKRINEGYPDSDILKFYEQNREALDARAAMNNARIQLDRVTAARRDVMRRRDISPAERDRLLNELREYGDQISRFIVSYGIER